MVRASAQARCLYSQPIQGRNPIHWESPFKKPGSVPHSDRERDSWSQLGLLACLLQADLLLLLCRGSSGSVYGPTSNQKVLGSIPSWIPVDFYFSPIKAYIK